VQGILYAENEEEHSEATGTIDVGARLSERSSLQRAMNRRLPGNSAIVIERWGGDPNLLLLSPSAGSKTFD